MSNLSLLLLTLLVITLVLILYYYLWFLRNPIREVPADSNTVVSPTDGRVINILEFKDNKIKLKKGFGIINVNTNDVAKRGYVIQIMMTPLDVHYQRAPIQGIVTQVRHVKGKFMNAVYTRNMDVLENEKNEILIEGFIERKKSGTKPTINVKVIQVAGFLARRIHSFVKEEEKILKGQHIGVIKLGSQVIIIIPTISLQVKK